MSIIYTDKLTLFTNIIETSIALFIYYKSTQKAKWIKDHRFPTVIPSIGNVECPIITARARTIVTNTEL